MRIGQRRDFELKDIVRLQPHAKIGDDNIPLDCLCGVKSMGEPLQSPDGPVVLNPRQQVTIQGIPAQGDRPCGIENRIETLVIIVIIRNENPPQKGVEGRRHRQHISMGDMLFGDILHGHRIDMDLYADAPADIKHAQAQTEGIDSEGCPPA